MIPALTYENNSWDFYLWISQELHFQTMWSILNTPYGLCTLRTTFNWKKNCANTNHPALKSQLALLLPVSALLCLCFLHPHVYMFAVGILHPCLLKIPWATRQPRAGLCSISWLTEKANTTGRGLLWEWRSAFSLPPFSIWICFSYALFPWSGTLLFTDAISCNKPEFPPNTCSLLAFKKKSYGKTSMD